MKLTPKRGKVLDVLKKQKRMLTAQEIKAYTPNIDLTTIYRSLELFQKDGLVREVILPTKESAYEYVSDVHDHVVCNSCKQIKHVRIERKYLNNIPELKHFDAQSIEVTVRGNCKQ